MTATDAEDTETEREVGAPLPHPRPRLTPERSAVAVWKRFAAEGSRRFRLGASFDEDAQARAAALFASLSRSDVARRRGWRSGKLCKLCLTPRRVPCPTLPGAVAGDQESCASCV